MKHTLPPELTAQLTRMIRRVRTILLTRGLLAVAAVAAGAVLAIMAIDAAVVLYHPAVRWAFSLAGLALAAATAWTMLVLPLARPLSITRMARVLETRHPDMQERISSAIELAEHGGGAEAERASAELIKLLTQDAKADLAGVQAKQEFTVRTVKPFLTAAAGVLLVLGLLFAVWPKQSWLLFLRALAPHREFDTLQASVLEVKPGDIMLLAQNPLRFEVKAPERHGLRAELHFQKPGGRRTVERMKRLSAQGAETVVFELELPSVEESFEYRVRYGSGYTRPYTVAVLTAPAVLDTRVTYAYPAYTGLLPTQTVGEAQSIAAVAGTRVRIDTAFDRPCAASLRINALTLPNVAANATNAVWLQTLSTNRTGRWSLALRDAYGFTNRPVWSAYTAQPDRPPEVTLVTPEISKLTVPPYDRLVCGGVAVDDFGFGAMELVIKSEKRGESVTPLKVTRQGAALAELEGSPDLQALYDQGLRVFKLCLRVADNLPPELGGPQVRESRTITVMLDMGARTLREQVREEVRKELEEQLRKAAQQLQEAANRVAQEKWSFDKPELPEKAAQKLEEAREAAVKAEELMEKAAQATEKTPFAAFAKDILDVRDQKVEPAFKKLEQIPTTAADKRKQAGEETEKAFREAAEKVNELIWKNLQEENRKQEEQSKLDELAQREKALAEQAEKAKMDKQEMQEWANRQNEAEQKLWQSKQQLEEAAFNKALENVRQAREAMQKADQALTPEADQALRREEAAAKEVEKAATLAEKAAEQALEANVKAEDLAETRAASDAVQKAAEKTAAAAEKAEKAAEQAQQAAEKRQANEALADAADRKAIAEQAVQAARQAEKAAQEAAQGAEQAQQAAEAQQAGQKEQAAAADKRADAQAEAAKESAQKANAEAVEAARQADQQGMEKAAEAGQLASESASFTQRAAELANEAADTTEAAADLPQAQKDEALKEAKGLAEQSKQVAAEAQEKAAQAEQLAKEQLDQLAQEEKAAAAKQATPEAVTAQAQEAAKQAQEAVAQAQEAVEAARQAQAEAKGAPALEQALAEQMAEASAMAKQAGELAAQSGERTQQAEKADLGEAQEKAETQQAMAEAQAAAQLAREAAAMAKQAAQQAVAEMAELKQASSEAAQDAAQQAREAAQKAAQAVKLAKGIEHQELQQAAEQSAASAQLTGEAATLAQQALQTAAKASDATDAQAEGQAQAGQAKARQALELARQAKKTAEERAAAEAPQLEAATKAQQVVDAVASALEAQEKKQAEAWVQVQGRMGGTMSHQAAGGGADGLDRARRVPLNQDWVRFRGEMSSEAYEEMLKKTPAEYRDLVKQYFEELSREGQAAQGGVRN
jgi:hypothetical protein